MKLYYRISLAFKNAINKVNGPLSRYKTEAETLKNKKRFLMVLRQHQQQKEKEGELL